MRALFIHSHKVGVSFPRFQRILIALIAATLISCVISPVANAVDVPPNGSYKCSTGIKDAGTPAYTITNGAVSSGSSCTGAVVIPAGVTSIGEDAFNRASSLISITIPRSVTSIGRYAFLDTTSLRSVAFEANSQLASIEYAAFAYSGLTSIIIPRAVTSLGYGAFYFTTNLTSITFESNSSLTSIDGIAFYFFWINGHITFNQ